MLTIPDAEALKVPVGLFASQDEPHDVVRLRSSSSRRHPADRCRPQVLQIIDTFRRKTFSSRCVCRTWPEQRHGWGGARGDLANPVVTKGFEELYTALSAYLRQAKRHELAPSPTEVTMEDRVDAVLERVGIARVRESKKERKEREKAEKAQKKALKKEAAAAGAAA